MKAKDTKKVGKPLSRSCPHLGCRKRHVCHLHILPLELYTINSTCLIIQQPYQLESIASLLREHKLRFYYD